MMPRKTQRPETRIPTLDEKQRTAFRTALLRWFDRHQRPLPWRMDHDPYRVWVSEIMLQQTRVAAVLEHYARFLKRFPDVHSLSRARTETVLAVWSGLGYYRRARMMHAAARQIVNELDGRYPETSAGWRELPGIGRYTAAAIASICYGEPSAVVDGNVERVLSRAMASTPATVWDTASDLLSPRRPGDFNQAMMELGATVCLPKAPNCGDCPIARFCDLQRTGTGGVMRRGICREKRSLSYLLITNAGRVLLTRRSQDESVMPGMWELPEQDCAEGQFSTEREPDFMLRHAIMNTDYTIQVICTKGAFSIPGTDWFDAQRVTRLALTGLARKILKRSGII